MFKDIFHAELYKQFSNKRSFVIPIVVFFTTFILSFIFISAIKSAENTLDDSLLFLTIGFIFVILLLIYFSVYFLIPIVMPIQIFSVDYKNNVIANTIASGASRNTIFLAKVLVAVIQISIYSVLTTIAFIIPFSLMWEETVDILTTFRGNAYATPIEIPFILFIIPMIATFKNICISILSITLIKDSVGSIFASFGFIIIASIISFFMLMPVYGSLDFIYDTIVDEVAETIINILITALAFFISKYIFAKSEY